MRVNVELHSGEERTYENAERVADTDKYKVTIYSNNGILAILNKGDIKNLLTEENE
jgi:hypothetical protein